jgi:WW domain-containing adapter protein with coiled-coil
MDRTNHDRRTTNKYPISDKRGNSDERDKDRNDRDRDRDRERSSNSSGLDRGGGNGGGGGGDRERIQRIGDWSEHVSSSGKKYYYNCKTEVSQWEKPREWIEKERCVYLQSKALFTLIKNKKNHFQKLGKRIAAP